MATEPPPRIVGKFEQIWRDWLYYLYEFIESHTGGSTPTPPATGLSWNAHGNIATGDASTALKVEEGSFLVKGPTGDVPADFATFGFNGMFFAPAKGAFRAGGVPTAGWTESWLDAEVGVYSVGLGKDNWAPGENGVVIGENCQALEQNAVAIGFQCLASGLAIVGDSSSLAMGKNAEAKGDSSTAIGTNARTSVAATAAMALGAIVNANNARATSIGATSTASGSDSLTVGSICNALNTQAIAVGYRITASGVRAITIGSGPSGAGVAMNNTETDTLWMGISSENPTLIMKKQGVSSTGTGFIGIIQQAPLSTLDIGGSVGFAYSLLTGSDAGSDTLSDEYVVKVNMQNVTAGNTYTINLPALGPTTIDRRIYYIKIISLNGTWGGGTAFLAIQPAVNDGVEDIASGGSPGTLLADNTPVNIGMSNANRGTSLTFIADNTSGGWWLI